MSKIHVWVLKFHFSWCNCTSTNSAHDTHSTGAMNPRIKTFETSSKRMWSPWKVALLCSIVVLLSFFWYRGTTGDVEVLFEPDDDGMMDVSHDKHVGVKTEKEDETARLKRLQADTRLPLVYFDVEIKGRKVGRIEMVLFTDVSPRCAHNFHLLVTGEAGKVPAGLEGEGLPLHFKGAPFYRIIDGFIDQAGINTPSALNHGQFDDDEGGLKLKHEHKGLLSMANIGKNTNTAHFSIMINPAPHLDGDYTIFGQVVSGFNVVEEINALSRGKPENTATADEGAIIADCGELRRGTLKPKV